MTISLNHGDLRTTLAALRSLRASWSEDQRRTTSAVTDLLTGGWRGQAAHDFGAGWSQWSHGAEELVHALDAMTELVEGAAATLHDQDAAAGDALASLRALLG